MADKKVITNPVKAIKAKCLDCCCDSEYELKLCPATDCPLYPFRFGKNPYRTKREYTDEQKAQMAECLKKARATKNKRRKRLNDSEMVSLGENLSLQ